MKKDAVDQAKERLKKAENSLTAFRRAKRYEEAEEAWTDFLLAASAIYAKLEQGAKGNQKSEPWFGRVKYLRKTDPLLTYIHQARNSNEHGIERVVGMTPPNRNLDSRPLDFNERRQVQIRQHDRSTGEIIQQMDAIIAGPTLKPVRVYDRKHGDHFDPPTIHLGKSIPFSDFVDGLGDQAVIYLASLVSEAEALL